LKVGCCGSGDEQDEGDCCTVTVMAVLRIWFAVMEMYWGGCGWCWFAELRGFKGDRICGGQGE